MSPARLASLGLGVVLLAAGCRPLASASVEPGSAVRGADPALPSAQQARPSDDAEVSSGGDGGGDGDFMLTVESHCQYQWRGKLVRADDAADKSGVFQVERAGSHELQMWPGDSLVLTTPSGGIVAVEFDNVTTGYMAHVEVTSDCSGIKRTLRPRPGA